jgi:hypothetical protein
MQTTLDKCKALIQSPDQNNNRLGVELMYYTLGLDAREITNYLIIEGWLIQEIDIAPRGVDFDIDGKEPETIPLVKTHFDFMGLIVRLILFTKNGETFVSIININPMKPGITSWYSSEPIGTYRKSKLWDMVFKHVMEYLVTHI